MPVVRRGVHRGPQRVPTGARRPVLRCSCRRTCPRVAGACRCATSGPHRQRGGAPGVFRSVCQPSAHRRGRAARRSVCRGTGTGSGGPVCRRSSGGARGGSFHFAAPIRHRALCSCPCTGGTGLACRGTRARRCHRLAATSRHRRLARTGSRSHRGASAGPRPQPRAGQPVGQLARGTGSMAAPIVLAGCALWHLARRRCARCTVRRLAHRGPCSDPSTRVRFRAPRVATGPRPGGLARPHAQRRHPGPRFVRSLARAHPQRGQPGTHGGSAGGVLSAFAGST